MKKSPKFSEEKPKNHFMRPEIIPDCERPEIIEGQFILLYLQ